jgi:GMP synthase-like glutamine amidotransferase
VSRVLVVANSTDADPGFVGERFEELGHELVHVLRDRGSLPPRPPAGIDVLLLLGSAWSVASPVAPDVLEAECALVHACVDAGVPVLGLCYGAQVLAHAYGGSVSLAPSPEVGVAFVDSLDPSLVPSGPWSAFHTDVVVVPPGAQVVASNACGVQAFVLPGALGVQFHPEVRPEVFDDWCGRFPELVERAGTTREELMADARGREEEARVRAHALVDAFLERVAGPATVRPPTPNDISDRLRPAARPE